MTVRFLIVLTLLLTIALPAHAADKMGIAVIVNDEPITMSDINDRVQLYTASAPTPPPDNIRAQLAQQILGKLIDEKLQIQAAAKSGITVSDAQVQDAFSTVAQKNNATADEFKAKMAARGVKPQTLMDQLRAEIAWGQLVRRKLRPQINITEAEIDSAFDKISAMPAPEAAPVPPVDENAAPENMPPAAPVLPDKTDNAQREQIATQLGMERLNKLAERYLRDLRATAFIDDKRG